MLADVQGQLDTRQLPLDEVGVTGIRFPVAVWDRSRGKQDTTAEASMSVDLAAEAKGAHLSRFIEVLRDCAAELTPRTIPGILEAIRERLGAERAHLEVSFPYFLHRAAPVTGASALLDYHCWLSGQLDQTGTAVMVGARVPVTSVCPCSKTISDYGAHNQRSHITIRTRLRRDDGYPAWMWLEELIEIAEAAASSPVYPLLKRPDERHVTMRAYDHPVFVEDMARAVALSLRRDERVVWFRADAASDESIHNHSAFARIQSTPPSSPVPPATRSLR